MAATEIWEMHLPRESRHFDFIAFAYDALLGVPPVRRWQELLELPCDEPLLDVGGGTGRVSFFLLPFVKGAVVADLSAAMLSRAKRKGGLLAVCCRAGQLPFPDASFGRIIVVDALHHFRPAEEAVGEMARVLRPGGRLVIEEPDLDRPLIKVVALAETLLFMQSRFHEPRSLAKMLTAEGLAVRTIRKDGLRLWFMADKPASSVSSPRPDDLISRSI